MSIDHCIWRPYKVRGVVSDFIYAWQKPMAMWLALKNLHVALGWPFPSQFMDIARSEVTKSHGVIYIYIYI